MTMLWPSRVLTFLLWLIVFFSAAYWILAIVGMSGSPVRASALAPTPPTSASDDLLRVLGPETATSGGSQSGAPVVTQASPPARMQLLGVVADRRHAGVALIALDGQPARPYRVGSVLEGGYKLISVSLRSAQLSPESGGDVRITLELDPLVTAPAGAPVNSRLSSYKLPGGPAPANANPAQPPVAAAAAAMAAAAAAAATGGGTANPDNAEKE